MEEYILEERFPTVNEYKRLRNAVGWVNCDDKSIAIGLHNSLFSVCVLKKNEVIGCGRVVGDGFGDNYNLGVRSLKIYNGSIYAVTVNIVTGCEVWTCELSEI
jgi:hypothetical protein